MSDILAYDSRNDSTDTQTFGTAEHGDASRMREDILVACKDTNFGLKQLNNCKRTAL